MRYRSINQTAASQSFPVPGVPGLMMKVQTQKVQTQNGGGATLTFDPAEIINPLK